MTDNNKTNTMGQTKEVDYRKEKIKSRIAWTFAIILALIWLALTLTPFFFMIMNSFRKQFDRAYSIFRTRGLLRTILRLLPTDSSDISFEA